MFDVFKSGITSADGENENTAVSQSISKSGDIQSSLYTVRNILWKRI
jgi:hypothetical protein